MKPRKLRQLALSLGCALGLGAGCDDQALVVVRVTPLPSDAARLFVSLTYRGQPARAPAPIDFPLAGQDLTQPVSFGVRLPAQTDGELVVGAGVLDASRCLSALGSATVPLVRRTPELVVMLQPAPNETLTRDERCTDPETTPLLFSVTPQRASSRGGEPMTLRGWGFSTSDCSLISVGTMAAHDVLCPSLVEITATVPPSSGALGPVPVQVLNRNGRRAVNTGLFSYYADNIKLGGAVTYPLGTPPSALASGLLDGDLRPDLVVTNRDTGNVTVLLNGGQGDFPAGFRVDFPVGTSPSAVSVGDLNGDGVADLLVGNAGEHTVSALLQTRPAAMIGFAPALPTFVNLLPSALALGDFNGDGRLDAAVANQLSRDVSVLLNAGSGHLVKNTQRDYAVAQKPSSVVMADLDRDGAPDLVVGSADGQTLTVLRNRRGDFPNMQRGSVGLAAPLVALLAVDLDGDDAAEVVAALANGTVQILWNDGSGQLVVQSDVIPLAMGMTALGTGDLDLDGYPDVVATTATEQRLYVLRNDLLRSRQRGLVRLANGYAVGIRPVAISVADFDGDQRPDVAVANQGASSLTILFNQSN